MKDYYSILGVSPNVSQEVLDAVYKNLVKNQVDNIEEIEEAYKILSNATMREEYDESFENNAADCQRDEIDDIIEFEHNETVNNSKKHKPKIFPVLILIVIVILGIKLLSSESPSANTIWGTFETEDGNLLSVEMIEDYDDDLYTAYITKTEIPWVKEYVVIDLESNEITYSLTEEKILFEFKNRKLVLNSEGKEYKKISDDSNYKSILDRDKMSINDIIGVYENVDGMANMVISKSSTDGMVNIWVGDFIGNTLGYTENIPYEDFFENGEVNISIEGKSFPMYFAHSKAIMCDAFQIYSGGFVKRNDVNISNTKNPNPDEKTYENSNDSTEMTTEIVEENQISTDEQTESTIIQDDAISADDYIDESEATDHNLNQENEASDENLNEEYKWYLNNSLFANQDQSVRIEVYEEDDEHFTMIWGDVYWDNEVEHNWQFSIDIIPDAIGTNGEFIYKGDDGRVVYYPDENYINVEMGDIEYDGIYKPF